MRIVLTGATGFIGGWLLRRLMADHEVICLTRKADGLPSHANVKIVSQDLTKPLETAKLPASVDAIIHMAQSRQFRKFPEEAQDIFDVNVSSTQRLLDYARKVKVGQFILASSGGVCGYPARPALESDPPDLLNHYLTTKYAAETLVQSYSNQFVPLILRYFFVYGEGQRRMFMPSLVERVLHGKAVTVNGQTGVAMNPIHVSDAVEATVRALELDRAEVINVAGPDVTTIMDLARRIGQAAGREPVYQFEAEKGPLAMIASIEKMRLRLGVTPKISLHDGIARVVADVRSTG